MKLSESDQLELKSSWDDSYLRTICAFANTKGGKLIVGIDDKFNSVQLFNVKKLQEDIPNKIISQLGIIPNVYVENFKACNLVVIEVEKSELAISYNGQFFVRVGSTTQVLKGNELSRFLINKSGSNWDEYVVQEA